MSLDSTEVGVNMSPENRPVIEDPRIFLDGFYSSHHYSEALDRFLRNKKIDPTVTDEEKRVSFLSQDTAKFALMDYGEYLARLKYDSGFYSDPAKYAIKIYLGSIEDYIKIGNSYDSTQEDREAIDSIRRTYHTTAAEQLVKDPKLDIPTEKIGRAIVTLIAISEGLETFRAGRVPDIQAITRRYSPH